MISFDKNDVDVFSIETVIPFPPNVANLIYSAEKFNWNLNVVGGDYIWDGWKTKIQITKEYLLNTKKSHFVYIDSRDAIFNGKFKTFVSHWKKYYSNCDILFSGETNCHPKKELNKYFIGDKYRFLNAGVFCGKVDVMLKMLKFIETNFNLDSTEFDDQAAYAHIYLSRMFNIEIDDTCKLFQTLWDEDGGRSANFDIVYSKDLIFNELYNTTPFVLHAPGPTCVLDQSIKILKGNYVT